MKHIIFAGGTGTRFWPASRKDNPKQFQEIIDNKPLVRLKYEYLAKGFKPEDIFLDTGIKYKDEVEKMLPELPKENFIYEPEMRDNGPAVALAVAYIQSLYGNEVISIQWADHYVERPNVFIDALKKAAIITDEESKSVVIGVPPRFPSPHRGYIKFGKKLKTLDNSGRIVLAEFSRFVEKPTLEVAKQYLESGDYSWNPAYWITKPSIVLDKYKVFAPGIYKTIMDISENNFSDDSLKEFGKLEKIGFDYIFSENVNPDEAYVLNTDMGWSDVGEWIALHETLSKENGDVVTQGNVTDIGSNGTLIYNYEPKELVATMNLKDMIVVNTKDVVAIFHKNDNGELKKFLKKLEEEGKTEYL